jgi:glutathione S-transferase
MESSRIVYHRGAMGRAALWVLVRKQLAAQAVAADAAALEQLRERYDEFELPLLEDAGKVVAGLRPIVSYLERSYGPPSVFPEDHQKRNQAVTLAEFAENALGRVVLALESERGWRGTLLAELRALLDQVREGIGRGALDSGACHVGDIAVAAVLVDCAGIRELDFDRAYADLRAYQTRVERALG